MTISNTWRRVAMLLLAVTTGVSAQRDVQFSSILFNEGDAIIEAFELTNFGTAMEDMSNWRLCSHDGNQVRIYSTGVGGMIGPGETRTLFARDFALATPFTPEAYSLAIFDLNAGGFGGTDNMIDHLQWSIGGADNASAGFRSGQAANAGLWTSATDWITTTAETSKIVLKESSQGGILHGPDDYETIVVPPFAPPCDLNGDGSCDIIDLDFLTTSDATPESIDTWLMQASSLGFDSKMFKVGDLNLDGAIDSADLGLLLNNFGDQNNPVYSTGNLNGDSSVDSSDLGLLLNNFGFESAASVAVPEPSALTLLVFVCIGLVGRRPVTRRR